MDTNKEKEELHKIIIQNQGIWALEYKKQQQKYKLQKNRDEKYRYKQSLLTK